MVSATTAAPTTTTRPATTAAPAPASGIVPLTPTRILDTRSSLGGRPGAVGPGREITFPVLGVGGVPSTGVTAVIVNITSTDATTPSYVTVWPSTDARPNTSNLNPMSDRPDHALVFTKLGTDGAIKLYNAFGNVHLIVDIAGYVATG